MPAYLETGDSLDYAEFKPRSAYSRADGRTAGDAGNRLTGGLLRLECRTDATGGRLTPELKRDNDDVVLIKEFANRAIVNRTDTVYITRLGALRIDGRMIMLVRMRVGMGMMMVGVATGGGRRTALAVMRPVTVQAKEVRSVSGRAKVQKQNQVAEKNPGFQVFAQHWRRLNITIWQPDQPSMTKSLRSSSKTCSV